MKSFDLNIDRLAYEDTNGDNHLIVTISGGQFPNPYCTTGSLEGGIIIFDLDGDPNELVDQALFSIQLGENYPGIFKFINYPEGYLERYLGGEAFNVPTIDCEFDLNECFLGIPGSSLLQVTEGKKLSVKLKKKPTEQCYQISSFGLETVSIDGTETLAATMRVVHSEQDELEAICSDEIDFNTIGEPLPLAVITGEGEAAAQKIGMLYISA